MSTQDQENINIICLFVFLTLILIGIKFMIVRIIYKFGIFFRLAEFQYIFNKVKQYFRKKTIIIIIITIIIIVIIKNNL